MNKFFLTLDKLNLLVLFVIILFSSSCVSNKNIAYFQDIKGVNEANLDSAAKFTEPVIQTDDILNINIFTLNPATGSVISQAATNNVLGGSTNTSVTAQQVSSFLVDRNGEIELTSIGKIKVAGLTTYEARELVRTKITTDSGFKKPNVQLRFANFKVSVLGEVNSPNTYTLPNERVSILDALSLAGDLTIFGKRENVLIVRGDLDGKKKFVRLNLNSSEIFNSPFYYLKQNDVIYVEPNKARVSANNAAQVQTIGIITSILSVLVLAVSVFK